MARQMENPALAARGVPRTDLLGSGINSEFTSPLINRQAQSLTRRCAISAAMAAIVAPILFRGATTMSIRQRLPNRRPHVAFKFDCEGQRYHCSASRDGQEGVTEIFLITSKVGSTAQPHAECAATLCSLALQYRVSPETIIRSVGGPIGTALELAVLP